MTSEIKENTTDLKQKYNIPQNWVPFFSTVEDEINHAMRFVNIQQQTNIVFPLNNEIFNAFNFTQPNNVKVVLIGMDPYPSFIPNTTIPVAYGLSFSTRAGAPIPRSLQNVFKEVSRTYPTASFANGDLSQWARQGVLMLNACLTVNKGSSGSHGGIWNPFLKKVIEYICQINPKVIFVLWGADAKKIGTAVIPSGKTMLVSGHPSPLNRRQDFIGNNHFVQINEILISQGHYPIDWSIYESI